MEDLISVIIPVYNVEEYIQRCMDSIVNQTYKNLEIIVVNDGTTDSSVLKIKDYIENDKRIRLINQENGGLSSARNTGINISTGKYIVFIDSDDFVDCKMVEKLYQSIKESNADLCICNFKNWDYNLDMELSSSELYRETQTILNKDQAIRYLLLNKINAYSWNKMYRRELFSEVRFLSGRLYEDIFTTFDVLLLSNKISIVKDQLYYYVSRENSITKKVNKKSIIDLSYRIDYVKFKLNSKYDSEFLAFAVHYYLMSFDWIINYRVNNNIKLLENDLQYIIKQFNDINIKTVLFCTSISNLNKIKFILFKLKILNIVYTTKYKLRKGL